MQSLENGTRELIAPEEKNAERVVDMRVMTVKMSSNAAKGYKTTLGRQHGSSGRDASDTRASITAERVDGP